MSIENLLKDLRKTIKLPENIGNWKNIFLSYQTEEDYSRNGLELDRQLWLYNPVTGADNEDR